MLSNLKGNAMKCINYGVHLSFHVFYVVYICKGFSGLGLINTTLVHFVKQCLKSKLFFDNN